MTESQASQVAPSSQTDTRLRPLGPLLTPRSVAVIGASERHVAVIETVTASDTPTWFVNPNRDSVLGKRCYPDTASLPERPDAAIIVVGLPYIEPAANEALTSGVPALVIPGLGTEAGGKARELAVRIATMANTVGSALLGVNCMGYAQPDDTSLWLGTIPTQFLRGHVSIISQSGSIAESLVTTGPRIGFRTVISSGSESNRDSADFLAYLAADEQTRAIGIFLETVRRPAAFSEALHRCREAGKPVVCLKVGRSAVASQVALTHTGAMVGSSETFSAYLRAHGAIEVQDIPEMVETLEVLGHPQWPQGPHVGAVSESGGEAGLLADLAEEAGLCLPPLPETFRQALASEFPNFLNPQNPVDAWAVGEVSAVYSQCFKIMRDTSLYDTIIAQVDLTRYRSDHDNEWCSQIVRALAAATQDSGIAPAVVSTNTVEPPDALVQIASDADIALLRGTGNATRAIAHVARWNAVRKHLSRPRPTNPVAPRLRPGVLSEFESASLLAAYGVPFAPFRLAVSPSEAGDAAEELGFPVVVKIDGLAHKSAQHGVALDLTSRKAVEQEAERMGGRVLVALQVPAGLEVICGMQRDPGFGPVIAIGLGGVAAEAFGVSAASLAPLDSEEANRLASSMTRHRAGFPPALTRLLADILEAMSSATMEHPEISSIDINPVVLSDKGAIAVDALIAVEAYAG